MKFLNYIFIFICSVIVVNIQCENLPVNSTPIGKSRKFPPMWKDHYEKRVRSWPEIVKVKGIPLPLLKKLAPQGYEEPITHIGKFGCSSDPYCMASNLERNSRLIEGPSIYNYTFSNGTDAPPKNREEYDKLTTAQRHQADHRIASIRLKKHFVGPTAINDQGIFSTDKEKTREYVDTFARETDSLLFRFNIETYGENDVGTEYEELFMYANQEAYKHGKVAIIHIEDAERLAPRNGLGMCCPWVSVGHNNRNPGLHMIISSEDKYTSIEPAFADRISPCFSRIIDGNHIVSEGEAQDNATANARIEKLNIAITLFNGAIIVGTACLLAAGAYYAQDALKGSYGHAKNAAASLWSFKRPLKNTKNNTKG